MWPQALISSAGLRPAAERSAVHLAVPGSGSGSGRLWASWVAGRWDGCSAPSRCAPPFHPASSCIPHSQTPRPCLPTPAQGVGGTRLQAAGSSGRLGTSATLQHRLPPARPVNGHAQALPVPRDRQGPCQDPCQNGQLCAMSPRQGRVWAGSWVRYREGAPAPWWPQRSFVTRAALGRWVLSSRCRCACTHARLHWPFPRLFPVLCFPCDMLTTHVTPCRSCCAPGFCGFSCNAMSKKNPFPWARTETLCGSAAPRQSLPGSKVILRLPGRVCRPHTPSLVLGSCGRRPWLSLSVAGQSWRWCEEQRGKCRLFASCVAVDENTARVGLGFLGPKCYRIWHCRCLVMSARSVCCCSVFPRWCSSVQMSCGLAVWGLLQAVQLFLCCPCSLDSLHGGDWGSCGLQVGGGRHPQARGRDRGSDSTGCRLDLLGLRLPPPLVLLALVLGGKWSSICRAKLTLALHQLWPRTVPSPAKCWSPRCAGL